MLVKNIIRQSRANNNNDSDLLKCFRMTTEPVFIQSLEALKQVWHNVYHDFINRQGLRNEILNQAGGTFCLYWRIKLIPSGTPQSV